MKWTQRRASLHGEIEESDRLAGIGDAACPACDSAFDLVTLGLDRLAAADSADLEALALYCRHVDARGGRVSIHASRPSLRRLLLASPLSDLVAVDDRGEPGPGTPFTCPHR